MASRDGAAASGGADMNKSISVTEIVAAYLLEHGYDGLYLDDGGEGCGCTVDDLRPCGEDMSDCKPGYKCICADGEYRFEGIGPKRDGRVAG